MPPFAVGSPLAAENPVFAVLPVSGVLRTLLEVPQQRPCGRCAQVSRLENAFETFAYGCILWRHFFIEVSSSQMTLACVKLT